MTDLSLTSSGTERSVPSAEATTSANMDANTAAAFQTVLNAMRTVDLSSASGETVAAFQTVLDALTSFGQVPVATATPAATFVAPLVAPPVAQPVAQPVAPLVAPPPAPISRLPPAVLAQLRTSAPWIFGSLYITIPPQHLSAIPDPPLPAGEDFQYWYCISKGTFVGITLDQGLASLGTLGVSGATWKAHKSQAQALQAFNQYLDLHMVRVVP
ncbi:hypothetical protein R3P38DRAFT_3190316 [Favolaschia claudopus]|uniref:Uncharacterized protein n=1 Tax=Favolaschia claudopus TaxID=2862362 RepID=A0AAW0BQ44_9AGAR